jgi:hypothetical protein
VWRDGDSVVRAAGPWSQTILSLLRHLEHEGFEYSPRVVGSGFDEKGREVLTYVPGEPVHPKAWDETAFPALGGLLRELHHATATFEPADAAVWRDWHGRRLGEGPFVVGHCDTGPWNFLAEDSMPVGLVDWETAGPVDPRYELAQACWLNAQLHDDDIGDRQGLPPLTDRARHVRLVLDGYELPHAERTGFVDRMIEFALQDAAAEAIDAGVEPETQDVSALWGITWRTRSAAWMQRHRTELLGVIETQS